MDSIIKRTHNFFMAPEDFQRRVREILNKLVPQKFEVLSKKMIELNLDTIANVQCLAVMIYEKSVREPLYCPVYAQLCFYLVDEIHPQLSFKSTILECCHEEFHRDHVPYSRMRLDIDRSESLAEIEYHCYLSQLRKLGNICFIGELFKSQVVDKSLIVEYVGTLLNSIHGASIDIQLDSVCKLLAIVGILLDTNENKIIMERFFKTIKQYHESSMLSSHIKYALLDIIELRDNNWKPRFSKATPTTLDEIRKPNSSRRL